MRKRSVCIPTRISIHASAKEATMLTNNLFSTFIFQSTPPRRRRPNDQAVYIGKHNFNPRLREGGDFNFNNNCCAIAISIHASAKEATSRICLPSSSPSISIHASAKEATATYCDTSAIMYISSLNNFFVHFF